MMPFMLKQMHSMSWGCLDLLVRLSLLIMPGVVLGLLAAILGVLVMLEGNLSVASWPLSGKP